MNMLNIWISSNDDKLMLPEVKAYHDKLIERNEVIHIWERKWLTIEEAAIYSGIGQKKLRELANKSGCPFAIWMGDKIHIIREKLDKFTDVQSRI